MTVAINVTHGWYGCDTGCCGHHVAIGDDQQFFFEHPWEALPLQFAHGLIRDAYARTGWVRDAIDEAGGYEIQELDLTDD